VQISGVEERRTPTRLRIAVHLPTDEKTPRREFLGQLALSAVAITATACAPAAMATQTAPAPQRATPPATSKAPPTPVKWDDSWVGRITGKHKGVFDCPEVGEGTLVGQAYNYYSGMKQAMGATDAEISAVLVIRHSAIPLAFDDEIWAKYEIGKMEKVKDPFTNKKWSRINPSYRAPADKPNIAAYTLDGLSKRGAILVGCGLAFSGMVFQIAEQSKQDRDAVRDELKAHLLPGLTLAPNGIFAVMRAQEAGCGYIRST
jgi:hypothetical protein